MKFWRQLACSSLVVLMVSACSDSALQRQQAKGDFEYLHADVLTSWKYPSDAIPQHYPDYDIPTGNYVGNLGKQVDIRPPQEPLSLIPGVSVEHKNNVVTFWMVKPQIEDQLWSVGIQFLEQHHVKTVQKTDNLIETQWVKWSAEDEEYPQEARYQFSKIKQGNRIGIKLLMLDLRQSGSRKASTPYAQERYVVKMANAVTKIYDTQAQAEADRKSRLMGQHIAVAMGTDRSGLPVVIARSPYDALWQRLPQSLLKIGFKVGDQNRSQGSMSVKYSRPDDDVWSSLGVKALTLPSGSYTLLLGDLANRTSINMTDSKGKPVKDSILNDFVPILSALLK